MPTYCKYCHETGHTAPTCPKTPSGKRVCFLCLKRGHVRADCPERISAAKRRRNGCSVAHSPSSTIPVSSESAITTSETLRDGRDDLTNTPKPKETVQVQDKESEISEKVTAPVHNASHLHSKYANFESSSQSTQEVDQNSPCSTSRPSSPISSIAEVHSDAEMDDVYHTSEPNEVSSSDTEMNEIKKDPKLPAHKSTPQSVSIRRSGRNRNAPDKLNL